MNCFHASNPEEREFVPKSLENDIIHNFDETREHGPCATVHHLMYKVGQQLKPS
jgi:hypothetical protein